MSVRLPRVCRYKASVSETALFTPFPMSHPDRYEGSRLRVSSHSRNSTAATTHQSVPLVRSASSLRPQDPASRRRRGSQPHRGRSPGPALTAFEAVSAVPPPNPTSGAVPEPHPNPHSVPVRHAGDAPTTLPPSHHTNMADLWDIQGWAAWVPDSFPTAADAAPHTTVPPGDPAVVDMDPDAELYWDALSQIGGLFRLDDTQYVFQDWDERDQSLKVSTGRPPCHPLINVSSRIFRLVCIIISSSCPVDQLP